MENFEFKKDNDGLSFNCEICSDQGCPQCNFGARLKKEKMEEEKEIPTKEELDQFFKNMKEKLDN